MTWYYLDASTHTDYGSKLHRAKRVWNPDEKISLNDFEMCLISRSENYRLLFEIQQLIWYEINPKRVNRETRVFLIYREDEIFLPNDVKFFDYRVRRWDEYPPLSEIDSLLRDFPL